MNIIKNLFTWALLMAATHVMAVNITAYATIENGQPEIVFHMSNGEKITGYSMCLYIGDKFSLENNYSFSARHTSSHSMSISLLDDGSGGGIKVYEIKCTSANNQAILGSEGELFRLPFNRNSTGSDGSIFFDSFTFYCENGQSFSTEGDLITDVGNALGLNDPNKLPQSPIASALPVMCIGNTYELPSTTSEGNIIDWDVSDETIATINNNQLTVIKDGIIKLYAWGRGNDTYRWMNQQFLITFGEYLEQNATTQPLNLSAEVLNADESKFLVVNLQNSVTTLTGYQMTLILPEGVTLQTDDEGDYEYTLSSRHKKDHTMTIRNTDNGGYLLVCFSTGKKVIDGTEGELFRLPLNVASTVSGTVQGRLQDILFSDTSAQPYETDYVTFNLTQSGGSQPSLTVQTLNLSTLPDMTVGAAPYALPQNTDQGLALTWTVQDATVASISNNQLTALKAGTTTVTATQAGNDSYQPFTKSFTLTVNEEQSSTVDGVSLQAEVLNADESKFLVVSLQNSVTTLTGYQMTLFLPEGVTLQTDDEGDYEYTLSSRHKKDHTMTIRNTDNGGYLLVCFSTGKKVIDGTEGELFRLPLNVASTVSGTVQGSLQDILFSDTSAQPYETADVTFNLTQEETPPVLTEQTLSLSALPELTVGDSPYALPQSTDQGLALTWTVQDATVASISNNQLTALKAGTTTVTATQAGNDSYKPFTKTFTLTVNGMPVVADPDTDISQLDNVIYVPNTELKAGAQNVTISINMKNSALIRGFQFDLYLPDGVTAAKSSKGKILASLNPNRLPEDDEHTLTMQERADGSITFLCGSQYPEDFIGNEGELISLTVNVAETMEDGEYPIVLQNMELTETDINKYYDHSRIKSTLTISSYMLGDINDDGIVNVRDYIGVANHILGNTPEGFIEKAGDVNEDGTINVRDYIGIANIILTGSIYGSTTPATMATRRQDVLEPQ